MFGPKNLVALLMGALWWVPCCCRLPWSLPQPGLVRSQRWHLKRNYLYFFVSTFFYLFVCFDIYMSICIYIYKPSSTFLPLLERGHSHSVMLPLYIRFPRPGVLSRWLKSRRKKNEWEKWVRSWISCALGTVCDQWPCWKNIWKS